jgi:hypothetical protein
MPSSLRPPAGSRPLAAAALTLLALAAPAAAHAQDPSATVPAPPTTTTPAPPAEPTVKPGVKLGDVDLSGQTGKQATRTIAAALRGHKPSDAPIVVTIAERPHRLAMDAIDYRYDASDTAAAALKAKAGTRIAPVILWRQSAVNRWIASLSKMGRAARDATARIGISKQRYTGSKRGWKVDRAKLEKLVLGALRDPGAERATLTLKVTRTRPAVTVESLKRRYATLVTVDRQTFRLRLFKRLKWVKTYKIAVGAAGHGTPAGTYSVTSKQVNPAWHVPNSAWAGSLAGQVIPGGAPNNPLKARWLGLRDGIGIHGTAETWSLGSRASHGCIRMHPSDVIDLYPRVPMGTTVKIR